MPALPGPPREEPIELLAQGVARSSSRQRLWQPVAAPVASPRERKLPSKRGRQACLHRPPGSRTLKA